MKALLFVLTVLFEKFLAQMSTSDSWCKELSYCRGTARLATQLKSCQRLQNCTKTVGRTPGYSI